jgi:P-type Ca2+ transporter type 2C
MIRLLKKIEHSIDRVIAKDWYSFDIDKVLLEINTTNEGLTSAEALDRLQIFGTNELPKKEGQPAWKLFLNQFNSPLMYIMMVAISVSVYIDNVSDAIFIIVVVSTNACVGFYQEHKANKSLQSLQQFVKLKTRVMRGGREQE